jgi:small subunit ribosomal protein S13
MVDKKEGQKANKPIQVKKKEDATTNIRGIVRLAGKDLNGSIPLKHALRYIRGISYSTAGPVAAVINKELGISPNTLIGELTDEQIEKIDKILFNLHNYNLPTFLLNRRSDIFDGVNKHLIMNDLIFVTSQDIEHEKKIYTWRGYRHAYGQKVRGQRTRNTGRVGMAVGVIRKSVLQQQQKAAAAKGEKAGGKAAASGAKVGAKKTAAEAAATQKSAQAPAEKK